jgi:hypothetical protein
MFCFRPADTKCFGKGSVSKPACKVPRCKGLYDESLHDTMARSSSSVNAGECEEDEEEEGYVNLA